MRYKIRMLIETLIGIPVSFCIESRIFNAVALFSAVILGFNSLVNIINGQFLIAFVMMVTGVISLFQYYLCRIKKKLNLAVLLFGLIGNAAFIVIFFKDSAIDGSGISAFILLLFLLIIIAPKKQHALWMILNPIVVIAILVMSYYYPSLITNNFASRISRFTNIGSNYIFFILMIGLITTYFKNTYNKQRALLEDKAWQLKEANQTKEKLFSIIAHDLRSPLASIQNYLELLNEFKFSEEEKKRMEQDLLAKTKNTDQLLSNLLYWTMNQMNGVKVNMIDLDFGKTISPVLKIIEAAAFEKGIEIVNLIPDDVFLHGDPDMIHMIVRNLVSNAIKFTLPGGHVRLTCKFENQEYKIMVSDNGVGIPLAKQAEIFSLKTNSTYGTKQEKGTGLGLVLCREFVELQNGSIGFEPANGGGTTFYFKLKLAKQLTNNTETTNQPTSGKFSFFGN